MITKLTQLPLMFKEELILEPDPPPPPIIPIRLTDTNRYIAKDLIEEHIRLETEIKVPDLNPEPQEL
jgi:hypothetical protein